MSNKLKVSLDFETYSEAPIMKMGAWGYAAHPSTEVICMAYAYGDDDPILWEDFDDTPDFLINPEKYHFHAWNSFFEYVIWKFVLCRMYSDIAEPPPMTHWTDTAAHAAALSMPRALGACGKALGMPDDQQKNKRGKFLIQRLSQPYRGKRNRDPELLAEFGEYCRQDVVSERAIGNRLRPLNKRERQVWELDQQINIRGVRFDSNSVEDALVIIDEVSEKLNAEVAEITNDELTNVSQRIKVLAYVEELGFELENYSKGYLASVLEHDDLHPTVRRLIEIRLQMGKTSVAKYATLNTILDGGTHAHGLLMYHGASTGRWTGRLFQPQNLPRPTFKDTDEAIELFKHRDATLLETIYDEPMEALSSCIRGMICAGPGNKLIVSDYSAIEARVLPWLAGQEDLLEVFRDHGKIYEYTASQIYKVPMSEVTSEMRFIGKVATLALGYQGGPKAFQGMAENYGVDISADLADKVKSDWREANTKIVQYWWDIEKAALKAVAKKGEVFSCRNISFKVVGHYLYCKLPSGRALAYYHPMIQPGRFDKDQVTFMGTNSVTRKWERQSTYGGKLVENITQAVARDLMAEAMLRLEDAGYEIVLTVHDEILAEVKEDFGSVKEFEELMCVLPAWAKGMPVESEGFECKRYRK